MEAVVGEDGVEHLVTLLAVETKDVEFICWLGGDHRTFQID